MVTESFLFQASTMVMTPNTTPSTTTIPSTLAIPVTEKLTKANYLLWHTHIMPAIHAAKLQGFLDGTEKEPPKTISKKVDTSIVIEPNPAYDRWVTQDQSVMGYIFVSLSREVLTGVSTMTTSAEVWATLANMYVSRMCARSIQTRIALATTKKGMQVVAEYYSKMRGFAYELATSGHPLGAEEFVSYLLAEHGVDFDPMVFCSGGSC
jgi:hypothetical protein